MMLTRLKRSRYMQYIASLTACLTISVCGMYLTWPSPSLMHLNSEHSPLGRPMTDDEGSWVVSLFLIATFISSPLIAILVEKFGRKTCLLICAVPFTAGWIIILFTDFVILLATARFLGGIGMGLSNVVTSIYIGEIADKDIRGKLGTAFSLLKLVGYVVVFCAGPFVSYTVLNIICLLGPVVFFLAFVKMPESPYYLIKKGRKGEARYNLIKLSSLTSTKDAIDKQLLEIQTSVDFDMRNKSSFWTVFTAEYRAPLLMIICVKILQQFSGVTAIDAYFQTIIAASDSGLSPEVSSILYGLIQLPSVLISAAFVDKMGRKPILIISALGCALSLIAEGVYFYLSEKTSLDLSGISWLPTSALVLFAVMNNFGITTLPYILLGELFATNVKEIASTVTIACGSVLAFLVSKFFKPLSNAWGMYVMFWIFAGICISGSIFVYFVLPETKGKSLSDIQVKLANRRNGTKKREEIKY